MDMNEFLKKAMEEEMHVDQDDSKSEFDLEKAKKSLSFLSGMKMVCLGRAAIDEKIKIINKLNEELNSMSKDDIATYTAKASVKIQSAAKKMGILDILISSSTISAMQPVDEIPDTIKSILQVNMI